MDRRTVGGEKRPVRLRATCAYAGNKRISKTSLTSACRANHHERNSKKCRCEAVTSAVPVGNHRTISAALDRHLAATSKRQQEMPCELRLLQSYIRIRYICMYKWLQTIGRLLLRPLHPIRHLSQVRRDLGQVLLSSRSALQETRTTSRELPSAI